MGFLSRTIDKLKAGLSRTREVLVEGVSGIRSLLLGRRLDEQLIAELEKALLTADVGVAATARLIDGIRADHKTGKLATGEDVLEYMKRELKAMWPEQDRRLRLAPPGTPTVILVTGINGAGKTTSISKLCAMLRKQDKKVLLAACDTFRAGAVRQLEIWGERLGVEVVKGQQGGDPAAVAFDASKAALARAVDVLIVDTAGRLHTQDPLMRQLAKIRSVLSRQIPGAPHETLLVLDATSGQNALRQAEEFAKATADAADSAAPGITGIFLAKLDGTAKGGIVVAIRSATSIPVKFVGVGETPDDIEPFDPDAFVEALFAA
ncbi:MAG: signal recognition particle-docking protein FtsY [Phycisphaerales bacterium]